MGKKCSHYILVGNVGADIFLQHIYELFPSGSGGTIRGTGTVESGDPYNVKITETRTISSVLVKTGDKVEKGAPLLLLEDKESKELTDAQAALDKAMLDFELALLSGDISNTAYTNVQSGQIASIGTYQSRIVAAEAEINKWQKKVDEATTAINHRQK